MQTFQSKFTTDISQHQRTMRAFREQTCAAVQQARTELQNHPPHFQLSGILEHEARLSDGAGSHHEIRFLLCV